MLTIIANIIAMTIAITITITSAITSTLTLTIALTITIIIITITITTPITMYIYGACVHYIYIYIYVSCADRRAWRIVGCAPSRVEAVLSSLTTPCPIVEGRRNRARHIGVMCSSTIILVLYYHFAYYDY